MNFFRQLGSFMMMGARAHARWELDVSRRILGDRKRLFILLLLSIPCVLGGIAFADQINGALPDLLGGKKAYSPAFYSTGIFIVSILIGLGAGLITGCIGAGGGFIIAPALMSAGIKGILAVGTDLFHIFAKAIMGSVIHKKLGNVSVRLAVVFLLGAMIGATAGGVINRVLYEMNPVLSDAFITTVYSLMLGFLGAYAMTDFLKTRKYGGGSGHGAHSGTEGSARIAKLPRRIQSIKVPPMITFDHDLTPGGRSISWVFLVISGAIVGFCCRYHGCRGRISHLSYFCICHGCIIDDYRWYGYLPDCVYSRLCRNKPVCHIRFYLLHPCNGYAAGISSGYPDWCHGNKSCAGHLYKWFLCNGRTCRIC